MSYNIHWSHADNVSVSIEPPGTWLPAAAEPSSEWAVVFIDHGNQHGLAVEVGLNESDALQFIQKILRAYAPPAPAVSQ